MKQRTAHAFIVLSLLIWFIAGLFMGFDEVALNPNTYDRLQAEINVYDSVGMEKDALSRVNTLLVDYLNDKTDDLFIEEEVFGIRQAVFNEQETIHMVDVKNLFGIALQISRVFALLSVLLLISLSMSYSCIRRPCKDIARTLGKMYGWCILYLAGIVLVVTAVFWTVGFDRLFIGFHQLFFTNDLWLMNPATDIMIRMFPSDFFERIVGQIALSMTFWGFMMPVCMGATLIAACWCYNWINKRFFGED